MPFWITRSSTSDDGFKEYHVEMESNKNITELKDELRDSLNFKYEPPNVQVARESYEHSLPRRVRDALQPTGYRLALPGELRSKDGEPAELYKPISATSEEIAEFGIGITLYFQSLKFFCVVLIICAAIVVPAQEENEKFNCDDVQNSLVGSVYCATADDLKVGVQGACDIAVTCLFGVAVFFSKFYFERLANSQDENALTTHDYSVVITNPPVEISDPDEYCKHFSQFGDVVLVSIIKNNGDLLELIRKKKFCEQSLNKQRAVKTIKEAHGEQYFNRSDLKWWETVIVHKETVASLELELESLNAQIEAAMNKDYHPWRVYITFNHEFQMRRALAETDISTYEIAKMNRSGLPPPSGKEKAVFKENVLNVNNAHEPDEILYENSNATYFERVLSLIKSYVICGAFIVIVYFIQLGFNESKGAKNVVAAFISLTNGAIPILVKVVTEKYEIHLNKSEAQLSAMLKLTVVRCFNSGILIYLSVPYGDRFGQDALSQIQGILIADAISTPILRLLDIPGLINRYYSAPKAVTQEEMNILWSAQDWSLAERYTDTLKTIFVGLMYAVLLPSGLYITAIAMFTTFWVDKYSLCRIWKRPPSLDRSLSALSRFFMMCALWMHVFFARIFFSNWPYHSEEPEGINCGFFFCTKRGGTSDGRRLTTIYNAFNMVLFIAVLYWFYKLTAEKWWNSYFYDSGLSPENAVSIAEEVSSATEFRRLANMSAYVPMVSHPKMNDPILMADVTELPPEHAPVHNKESVFTDAPSDPSVFSVVNTDEFPTKNDNDLRVLFSTVRYYENSIGVENVYDTNTNSGAITRKVISAARVYEDEQGALPNGWALKHTPEGKPYYVNHINRTTQWERPQYG